MTHFYRRAKRLRGRPYPEANFGLERLFGPGGWCVSCGTEYHPQTGDLTLQSRGVKPIGAWVPYWLPNILCLGADVAAEAEAEFGLVTRPVDWHGSSPGEAVQVVLPVAEQPFYDTDAITAALVAQHGVAGQNCAECGRWKWMPSPPALLPELINPPSADQPVLITEERYGDGGISASQILLSADLIAFLHERSPRDFDGASKLVEAPAAR